MCHVIFTLSRKFKNYLERFQNVQKLSRLFRNFPACPTTFHTVNKLSRPSWNLPDCLETFQNVWKLSSPDLYNVLTWFQGKFCKYAQKNSGRQCRRADGVFLPLSVSIDLVSSSAKANLVKFQQGIVTDTRTHRSDPRFTWVRYRQTSKELRNCPNWAKKCLI